PPPPAPMAGPATPPPAPMAGPDPLRCSLPLARSRGSASPPPAPSPRPGRPSPPSLPLGRSLPPSSPPHPLRSRSHSPLSGLSGSRSRSPLPRSRSRSPLARLPPRPIGIMSFFLFRFYPWRIFSFANRIYFNSKRAEHFD